MLESISARGWGRASFVVACIAVVVIGYVYGSELRACGPNPSPFAQHRQCPSQQQAGCSRPLRLVHLPLATLQQHREVRRRILHWQANESPVLRRYTFHWQRMVLLYLSRPLVWLWVGFASAAGSVGASSCGLVGRANVRDTRPSLLRWCSSPLTAIPGHHH